MRLCLLPPRAHRLAALALAAALAAACPPPPPRPDAADAAPGEDRDLRASGDPDAATSSDGASGRDLASAELPPAPPDLMTGDQGGAPRCREPTDCPSQVCLDSAAGAGSCARPEDVIYVDNRGGSCMGSHAGTQADPLCTLAEALALPVAGPRVVRLAPSAARYDGAALTESVALYGPGLQLMAAQRATVRGTAATGYAALRVTDPGGRPKPLQITIDGVDLTGSLTNGTDGALRCQGDGRTTVILARSQVYSSAGPGISASACVLELSRALVNGTSTGGLKLEDGRGLVTNSFFINSPRGPAFATRGAAELRVRFSTVVGNGAAGQSGASDCQSGKPCVIESSLLVQNKRPMGGSQLGGQVQLHDSAIDEMSVPGAGLRLNAAPEFAGATNYRLAPGPGSRACCIDQLPIGAQTRDVLWDYDGNGRPAGQGWDIGGSEVQ